jgi:tetratricopeptide (TPR) repeat protein
MSRLWVVLALFMLSAAHSQTDQDPNAKTVIGPSNIFLYDGARALMAGDAEEGVRLTLQGLAVASGLREKKIAHSNLCAGFVLLGQAATALGHCDWVLEHDPYHWRTYNNRAIAYLRLERYEESEADIEKGQELRPNSEKLKEVKGMYLDQVDPVAEKITIDDRRNEPASAVEKPD